MAEKQTIIFEGVDNLSKVATGVKGSIDGLSKAANIFGAIFITGAVAQAFKFLIKEASESEKAIQGLNQSLKNIGQSTKFYSDGLKQLAGDLQQVSSFTDEQVMGAMSDLNYITQDASVSMKYMGTVTDFAAAMNIDLASAASILGKAYEGNTTVLKRYGITLAEGATGTVALDEVSKRFAGAAQDSLNTLDGQWKLFAKNIGEAAEALGTLMFPALKEVVTDLNLVLFGQKATTNTALEKMRGDVAKLSPEMQQLYTDTVKIQLALSSGAIIPGGYDLITMNVKELKVAIKTATDAQQEYNTVFTQGAKSGGETPMTKAKKEYEDLYRAMQKTLDIYPLGISLSKSLGEAIGATAAGSTVAWANFAKSALSSVISFVETALQAQMLLWLAAGNLPMVAAGVAGLVGLEAIKGVANYSPNATTTNTTTTDTGGGSSSSVANTTGGAVTASAPTSTNLSINLFNPVFMDKESKLQTINDMLNLASANGWNVTRSSSPAMA